MNKKIMGIVAALLLAGGSSAFAKTAIGLQGGYSPVQGYTGADVGVTFKLSSLDAVFAVNVGLNGSALNTVAGQADWWMQNERLTGIIHWYYGPGAAAGVYGLSTGNVGFYAAFRAVVGVNVFVIDPLEVYLQAAWQPGIYVSDSPYFDLWRVPVQIGFRFWF